MKKLNWLEQFAQEQATKINKTASVKKAERAVVDASAFPGAQNGATVEFGGEQYKVVDANFADDKGPGILVEKVAAYEGLEADPMGMAMGAPAGSVAPGTAGQEYHRVDPGNIYQTYDNDQDAQWGQSSAQATEQEIAGENATDRTTVPGKFTKSPGLNTAPTAPVMEGTPGAAPASIGTDPQAPATVDNSVAPAGDFGTEVATDTQSTESFEPASPVGETEVAPLAVDTEVAPATTEEAPATDSEDVEVAPDAIDGEDKKEDKFASNRILTRILKAYTSK